MVYNTKTGQFNVFFLQYPLIGWTKIMSLLPIINAQFKMLAYIKRKTLIWVPGVADCSRYQIADVFAKRGGQVDDEFIDQFVGTPIAHCKSLIRRESYGVAQMEWICKSTCSIYRALCCPPKKECLISILVILSRVGKSFSREHNSSQFSQFKICAGEFHL